MVATRRSHESKKGNLNTVDLVRKEVNVQEMTLDELRIEVEFERKRRQQWRTLLKESARDIGKEEEILIRDGEDEEDERWLNKYKIQRTKNAELEAEHEDLLAKINITKLKLKDAERSMALKNPLDYSDAEVRKLLVTTNKAKNSLTSELKDYEWRLDSESQKFSKAEEQRKTFMVQLYGATEANRILNTEHRLKHERMQKSKSQNKLLASQNSEKKLSEKKITPTKNMTPRRSPVKMLDPKKGPVKKSALVKNLPKLEERKRKTNY
ncbi:uncharacterized protein LOC134824702 isoform X1 [Bolinopsis microptera]|uniref:uncharacterized protein LOC134824702 isoform X1 n=1 Tax=Bolinopsis microptera TaxID=2820187 RepID=UPI00307A07BE